MEPVTNYKTALDRCRRLASKSEICPADLIEKLKHWGIEPEQIDKIIDNLTKEKFIDEQRYANAFVKDKTRFNHWGRIKTTAMLKQKRIQQSVINKAFSELDEKDYLSVFEFEMEKKDRSLKAKPSFERRQKVASYLLSKGFEPELVFDRIKEIN
jgi:regulatory protein